MGSVKADCALVRKMNRRDTDAQPALIGGRRPRACLETRTGTWRAGLRRQSLQATTPSRSFRIRSASRAASTVHGRRTATVTFACRNGALLVIRVSCGHMRKVCGGRLAEAPYVQARHFSNGGRHRVDVVV